ncbi:MAG: ATP-binding cassette domain-containing protein [Clostridia bacterium]|nr:ATP-binding cassette domain-containing protein [Clostridia bacterium]
MIVLDKITKSFDRPVLKNFSHVFPEGETSCILGPSGCGKTTLLRIIAGLLAPDSGRISGMEGRRISAVFQENRLFENLTAEKNLLLTARPGFTREDARELLSSLGLPLEKKPVGDFSGGMQRRVAIARALAAEYDVLLLDEPLTALDAASRDMVRSRIAACCAGKTCLWVTHFPEDAEKLGGNVLYMKETAME